MQVFLIVAALIFLVFGSLLLLSPESVRKISDVFNLAIFNVDEKMPILRRPLGIGMLILSIVLWYIGLWK